MLLLCEVGGGGIPQAHGLEGLDVRDPVKHPSTDLEVARPDAMEAPALQRARAQRPAPGEVELVEVGKLHEHGPRNMV